MISFPFFHLESFKGLMKHPDWFSGKLQGDGNKKRYSEIRNGMILVFKQIDKHSLLCNIATLDKERYFE